MVEGRLQRTTTGDGAILEEWIMLTCGRWVEGVGEMIVQSKRILFRKMGDVQTYYEPFFGSVRRGNCNEETRGPFAIFDNPH